MAGGAATQRRVLSLGDHDVTATFAVDDIRRNCAMQTFNFQPINFLLQKKGKTFLVFLPKRSWKRNKSTLALREILLLLCKWYADVKVILNLFS
jgi:hypothetical protein